MLIHDQKTEILYEVVVNDEEQYSIWLTRTKLQHLLRYLFIVFNPINYLRSNF
jgi:hypothetical protein